MKALLINQRTRGPVLLCIQERAYETCANPESGFCTDLTSPDTGRGICLLYRTNWEERYQLNQPQKFSHSWWSPPPQHGIWIVQLRTQSYQPSSSFPRYIAGEIGRGRYKCTSFLKLSSNYRTLNPGRVISRLSGEFPSFHHIRYTSMWSFSTLWWNAVESGN